MPHQTTIAIKYNVTINGSNSPTISRTFLSNAKRRAKQIEKKHHQTAPMVALFSSSFRFLDSPPLAIAFPFIFIATTNHQTLTIIIRYFLEIRAELCSLFVPPSCYLFRFPCLFCCINDLPLFRNVGDTVHRMYNSTSTNTFQIE